MKIEKCIVLPSFMFALVFYNSGNKTATDFQKVLQITYSNIVNINKSLVKLEWATINPIDGKSKAVVLTEKGQKIAISVLDFLDAVGIILKEEERNANPM